MGKRISGGQKRGPTPDTKINGYSVNDIGAMLAGATVAANAADTAHTQHDATLARKDLVEALARRKYEHLQRGEYRKHPSNRTKDTDLWAQAHKDARREERSRHISTTTRRYTKRAATATKNTVRGESASLWARNKTLAAPWLLAAPYAALGEVSLAAANQPGAAAGWLSVLAGGVAAGGSWLAWRTGYTLGTNERRHRPKLRDRVPALFRPRVQAGMGLASAWDTAMPLIDGAPAHTSMGLALLAGTSYLGLSWWHHHDHPIPEQGPVHQKPEKKPSSNADELRRINEIITNWGDKVAPKLVPGSTIAFHRGSTDAVLSFVVTLDADERVTRRTVNHHVEQIAMKLGVFEDRLSFETGQHPSQVVMHVRENDPVFTFDQPVVLCNGTPINSRHDITPGADVDIVFGSYIDGSGYASVRFLQKGSVNSMFILGEMGSGKTRALEIIAVALRMLGCYTLWLDGQEGASSPLLNTEADEAFDFNMHDRSDDRGLREFTEALGTIAAQRNRSLQNTPELGGEYTYDPNRPPVVAMIDEAHEAFQTTHATYKTYGFRLETYAVQLRKLGMGMVCLSQDYDKTNTFGRSSRLRGSLVTAGNLVAMRVTDRSRAGMLPSTCPKLDALPGRGYGYLPLQSRADAMWRTLDLGDDVQATLREWMSRYEPGKLEFTRVPSAGVSTDAVEQSPESDSHAHGEGPVRFHFGTAAAQEATPDPSATPAVAVTPAEQRALDVLRGDGGHTGTSLAAALGISSQVAGRQLKSLTSKGFAGRGENGVYTAVGAGATPADRHDTGTERTPSPASAGVPEHLSDSQYQVLDAVRCEFTTPGQIADQFGISRRRVGTVLGDLVDLDLVTKTGSGPAVQYTPAAEPGNA